MSLKRNTSYNLMGALLPALVALVTVPLYIPTIGTERFGALAIAWLVAGAFGFFDLGLTRATAYRVAQVDHENEKIRGSVLGTALVICAGSSVIAGIAVTIGSRYYFGIAAKVSAALRPELVAASPWMGLIVPSVLVSAVLSGALQGRHRFVESNLISIFGTLGTQVAPLIAAIAVGPRFTILLASITAARLLVCVYAMWAAAATIAAPAFWTFTRREAAHLLDFGKWVMISSILGPILMFSDRFLIGTIIGATAVALYNIPFQLAQRLSIIPAAFGSAVLPKLTQTSDRMVSADLFGRTLKMGQTALAIVAVGALAFIDTFLPLWLGHHVTPAMPTTFKLLVLAFYANGFAALAHFLLMSQSRPHVITLVMLVEVPFYLGGLYIATAHYGLLGSAASFLALCILDALAVLRLARVKIGNAFALLIQIATVLIAAGISLSTPLGIGAGLFFAAIASSSILAASWRDIGLLLPRRMPR